MSEPKFAPEPSAIVKPIPTARVKHRGYQYWCEGFEDPESHDDGYRYQIVQDVANPFQQAMHDEDRPITHDKPFPMVTTAAFAARTEIDNLLAALEQQADVVELPTPGPPTKAKRKTRAKPKPETETEPDF